MITDKKTYTLVLTEAEMGMLYDAIRNYYDWADDEEVLQDVRNVEQKMYEVCDAIK